MSSMRTGCCPSVHRYILTAQARPRPTVGALRLSFAQENELLGSSGIPGREREAAESRGLSEVGWGAGGEAGHFRRRNYRAADSCPPVPLAGDSWVQMLTFLLLLPKVESTLGPSRIEPCPRAGREPKTKARIFKGEANLRECLVC